MAGSKRKRDADYRAAQKRRSEKPLDQNNRRTTRHMHSLNLAEPARNGALQTTELLERILTNLDPISIIKCMRVTKHFHNCIVHSPVLQELVFFRPSTEPREWWSITEANIVEHKKAFFTRFTPSATENLHTKSAETQSSDGAFLLTPARLCPALRLVRDSWSKHRPDLDHARVVIPLTVAMQKPWQDMQLTSPPCFQATVQVRYSTDINIWTKALREVSNESGLTVGDVLTEVLHGKGRVSTWVHSDHVLLPSWRDFFEEKEAVLVSQVRELEQKYGCKLEIDRSGIEVSLHGMRIASDKERLQVEAGSSDTVA